MASSDPVQVTRQKRIGILRRKLAAREGNPAYTANREALRAQIAQIEGAMELHETQAG